MKPGWKSTEFWLAAAAALLGAFVGSGVLPSEHWAIKVAGVLLVALATLGYSGSRGMAKGGTAVLAALMLVTSAGCASSLSAQLERVQIGASAASDVALVAWHAECLKRTEKGSLGACQASRRTFVEAMKALGAALATANRAVWAAGIQGAK